MATNLNRQTNRQYQDEDDVAECPLCLEPLDIDDANFYPCACGYQICRFCWHRMRTDENGLCPQCRKPYEEDPAAFKPMSEEELLKVKGRKRGKKGTLDTSTTSLGTGATTSTNTGTSSTASANGNGSGSERERERSKKRPAVESRKAFADLRVVQKNLVFVVGLSNRLANADVLKRSEIFGQFGKIVKVVVSHNTSYAGSQPSASAYITYQRAEDAMRAIWEVNNKSASIALPSDAHKLRCSLGTTKYCSQFLKGAACSKPDCMYLHEVGDPLASFTKENMQQGMHTRYEHELLEAFKRSLTLSPKTGALDAPASEPTTLATDTSRSGSIPGATQPRSQNPAAPSTLAAVEREPDQSAKTDSRQTAVRSNPSAQASSASTATSGNREKTKTRSTKANASGNGIAAEPAATTAAKPAAAGSGHRRTRSGGQKTNSSRPTSAAITGTAVSASSIPLQVVADSDVLADASDEHSAHIALAAPVSCSSQSPSAETSSPAKPDTTTDGHTLLNGSRCDETENERLADTHNFSLGNTSLPADAFCDGNTSTSQFAYPAVPTRFESVEREPFAAGNADANWLRPRESDSDTQSNLALSRFPTSAWPNRSVMDPPQAPLHTHTDGVPFGIERPGSYCNIVTPTPNTNAIVQQLLAGAGAGTGNSVMNRLSADCAMLRNSDNSSNLSSCTYTSHTRVEPQNNDFTPVPTGGGMSLLQAIINSSRNASADSQRGGARHVPHSQPQNSHSQLAALWSQAAPISHGAPASGGAEALSAFSTDTLNGRVPFDARVSRFGPTECDMQATAWSRLPPTNANAHMFDYRAGRDASSFECASGVNRLSDGDALVFAPAGELQRRVTAAWNSHAPASPCVNSELHAHAASVYPNAFSDKTPMSSQLATTRLFETSAPSNTTQSARFGNFPAAFSNGWN